MYVRCAYFVGTVAPEHKAEFDRVYEEKAMPIIATFPKIRSARLLRGDWHETAKGAPPVYQVIELTFDSKEDLEAALASEPRAANLKMLKEAGVEQYLDGSIYHINYSVPARA